VLPAWMFPGGGCRRRSSWAAPASPPAPGSATGAASSPSPPSSPPSSCAASQRKKSSKLPLASPPTDQPGGLGFYGRTRAQWKNYEPAPARSCAAPPQRAPASRVPSRTFLVGWAGPVRASCIPDGPLISLTRVSRPAKELLLLFDVLLKAHGPFIRAVATWAQNTIQRPDPAGGLRFGVTPRRPPLQ